MKTLNCLMILIIILLLVMMFGIHRDIQNIKKIIEDDIRAGGIESDNATDCMIFPCYTAPHKMWVSQKYLTKRKRGL